MRLICLFLCLGLVPLSAVAETRCGWFTNPTPANVFLTDAEGEWTLSAQGRGGVPGFDKAWWESGNPSEWVAVSPAGYGFGCACVEGDFGPVGSDEVLQVRSYRGLPLARCVADPALPERSLEPMQD